MLRLFALASIVVLAGSRQASAQTSRDQFITIETTKSPPAAALRSSLTSGFLEASKKDAKAVVSTGLNIEGTPLNLQLRLGAQSPIGKDDDAEASVVDLKGLGDGTEVELALHGYWWAAPERPSRVVAWCEVHKTAMSRVPDCTHLRINQVPDSLYGNFLKTAGWSNPVLFDIGWKVGRAKASYLEENTLKAGSFDKLAQSLGTDLGILLTSFGPFKTALLAGGYHYEVDFKKSSATQICTPYGTTAALRCRSAVIGRPKKNEGALLSAEMRAYFNPRWAINPQFVRSQSERTWTLEMPIYFVPDGNGALIGGISPKYASDSKDWELRIFVGKALGL
jgi:hypothetical protein